MSIQEHSQGKSATNSPLGPSWLDKLCPRERIEITHIQGAVAVAEKTGIDKAEKSSTAKSAVSHSLSTEELLRSTLAVLAPGTALRDGLERILRGRTGALIVLGIDDLVESLATGGFTVNVAFSATRLRELAKMDGAIIVDETISRIHQAAVQLVPDPSIATDESGTRHRTAERVAKQTGRPVISVSKSMHIIAVYVNGRRHVLEGTGSLLSRGGQALATLERYKKRLDEVSSTVALLEVEDLVTVREVCTLAQRLEMVRRIATEIEGYLLELGEDGRLLALQLEELMAGVDFDRELITQDYLPLAWERAGAAGDHLQVMAALSSTDLFDLPAIASVLGFPAGEGLDSPVIPRGYRVLARIPRLPRHIADRLIEHFGNVQKLLAATSDDLQTVEGIGESRARTIRDGLTRIADPGYPERYA